jgi:hypothetical protein
MRNVLIKTMAVMAGVVLAVKSEAQTVNAPIVVPLHFTQISTGTYKLGIYVGIGNGATPKLFEFNTGATGFYATYSPNPGVSPWWGSRVTSSQTPVNISYASGLHYTGYLAAARVTLFASSNRSSALITTPTAKIGQMDSIVDDKTLLRFGMRTVPFPEIRRSMARSTATLAWVWRIIQTALRTSWRSFITAGASPRDSASMQTR